MVGLTAVIMCTAVWPIAVLATLATSSLFVAIDAYQILRENKFPQQLWTKPGQKDYDHYIKQHISAKPPQATSQLTTTLGRWDDVNLEPIIATSIRRKAATWYRTFSKDDTYNILRIELPHTVPSTVINSHVERSGILPDQYGNGTYVKTNPELEKYFTVTTVHGAEREVTQLLAINVLWELLIQLDSCDVELRDNYLYFIWSEGALSDAIIDGRQKHIEAFLKSFLHGLHRDTAYGEQYLQSIDARPRFLSSIESLLATSGALVVLIIAVVMFFAIPYYDNLSDALLIGVIALVPAMAASIGLVLTIAMLLAAGHSLVRTWHLLATARRIRQYALLYETRA